MDCRFSKSWIGRCGKPDISEKGFCEEHESMKCGMCGEQATYDCSETVGPFVCGVPLCSNQECKEAHIAQHERREDPGNAIMRAFGGGEK